MINGCSKQRQNSMKNVIMIYLSDILDISGIHWELLKDYWLICQNTKIIPKIQVSFYGF